MSSFPLDAGFFISNPGMVEEGNLLSLQLRVEMDRNSFPITPMTEVKAEECRFVPTIAAPILDGYPTDFVCEAVHISNPRFGLIFLAHPEKRRNIFQVEAYVLSTCAGFRRG